MKIRVHVMLQEGHNGTVYVFTSVFLKKKFAWFKFYKSGSWLNDLGKMWVPRWDQLTFESPLATSFKKKRPVTNLATFWATLTFLPWRDLPVFLSECALMWPWFSGLIAFISQTERWVCVPNDQSLIPIVCRRNNLTYRFKVYFFHQIQFTVHKRLGDVIQLVSLAWLWLFNISFF